MPAATSLYVLADAPSITAALRQSLFAPTAGVQFPDSVLGDQRLINLYLITADQEYDTRSGSASVTPRLALARKQKSPTGGTFTLTFGADTTPDLAYNATAAAIETALNALASITLAGGVDLVGAAGGPYQLIFRTVGARALLTGDTIDLLPSTGIAISEVVAGDGSTRAIQSIRLQTRVVALTETWTQLLDAEDGVTPIGWTGTLNTNTVEVLAMLEGSSEVDAVVELEVTEAGAKTTLMQQAAKIRYDIINDGSLSPLVILDFATAAALAAETASRIAADNFLDAAISDEQAARIAGDAGVEEYSIQRANHTGTQLAATISDFAATVRATVLTGLSLATSTAITAADSALVAWGKLQAQITTLTGRTISAAGLATGGGDLSANRTITVTKSTAAQVITGTDDATAVTPLGNKAALDARFAGWLRDTGYLYSDGATANRRVHRTGGARTNIAGAPAVGIYARIVVPTESSTAEIFSWSSATTALASATAWSYGLAWNANDLVIRVNGATPATDFRTYTLTGARTTYSGQTIDLHVDSTLGTTAPVVRINNVIVAGTSADGAGTDPDWNSASLVCTNQTDGYNWPAGTAPTVIPYLGTLTDAERKSWLITGVPPAWVAVGGSAVELITNADNRTFAGGVGTWAGQGGPALTTDAGSLVLSGGAQYYWDSSSLPGYFYGARYRITFDVTENSTGLACDVGGGGVGGTLVSGVATGTGTKVFEFTAVNNGRVNFLLSGFSAAAWKIDNVSLKRVGALTLPSYQAGRVVGDATAIGDNPGRCVGMTQITDRKDFQFTVNTSTNGNEQLLGGEVLDSTLDVLDSIEQEPLTGTPTTAIGSISAGAQYKTSGALAAGINPVSLVTRKTASNNLWNTSNSTDVVRTTVKGHRR